MTVALVATSHSPLIGKHDPDSQVRAEVDEAFAAARSFIERFDPELVVMYAPDHYNGFLYDMMPPFCVGASANSVGDYGLPTGPLQVDRDIAHRLARRVLQEGVDVALSEDMQVDHGFVQPLQILFGAFDTVPVVPIFINCVADPLGPASRSRHLGLAVGRALVDIDRRVLVIGSGGLSHDPPVPRLAESPPEVVERLKHGRNPTPEQRALRESRTLQAAKEFKAGSSAYRPLNPEWDQLVLRSLAEGDFASVDGHDNDWFVTEAGHSSHEVRTWIAAYATLSAHGSIDVELSYYRPIPEWFAGFAVTTALPRSAERERS